MIRRVRPVRGEEWTLRLAGSVAKADRRETARARVPVECGDLPFLIKRDGTWLYRGTPINRKELVCLFASVLRREEDGSWWLQTPAERGRIEVEDAPFVAVETGMDRRGPRSGAVVPYQRGSGHHRRRRRTRSAISHDILDLRADPLYLDRPGAGHLGIEARINRATYYELVALAEPRWIGARHVLGVWSQGQFFSLGDMPPERDVTPEELRARLIETSPRSRRMPAPNTATMSSHALARPLIPAAVLVPIVLERASWRTF